MEYSFMIVKIWNSLTLPMASLFGEAILWNRWYKIWSILSALRLKRLWKNGPQKNRHGYWFKLQHQYKYIRRTIRRKGRDITAGPAPNVKRLWLPGVPLLKLHCRISRSSDNCGYFAQYKSFFHTLPANLAISTKMLRWVIYINISLTSSSVATCIQWTSNLFQKLHGGIR